MFIAELLGGEATDPRPENCTTVGAGVTPGFLFHNGPKKSHSHEWLEHSEGDLTKCIYTEARLHGVDLKPFRDFFFYSLPMLEFVFTNHYRSKPSAW